MRTNICMFVNTKKQSYCKLKSKILCSAFITILGRRPHMITTYHTCVQTYKYVHVSGPPTAHF